MICLEYEKIIIGHTHSLNVTTRLNASTPRCGVLPSQPKRTVVLWGNHGETKCSRGVISCRESHQVCVRWAKSPMLCSWVKPACNGGLLAFIFCSLSSSPPFLWIFLAAALVLLCAGTPRTHAAPPPPVQHDELKCLLVHVHTPPSVLAFAFNAVLK